MDNHDCSVNRDQARVVNFRDHHSCVWHDVSVVDSLRFTAQELFELDSVLMRMGYQDDKYVRNSADPDDMRKAMILELGQAYLMLLTLANNLGVCLPCALTQAFDHQQAKLHDHLLKLALFDKLTDEQRDLLAELSR